MRHMLSLWPASVRRPFLRLAVALIVAPLVLAAVMTAAAFMANSAAQDTRSVTVARTRDAAEAFFLYLPLFSVTVGLAGTMLMGLLGWRQPIAWAVVGAALGAAISYLLGSIAPGGVVATHVVVFTVLGLILFSAIRAIAGIRAD